MEAQVAYHRVAAAALHRRASIHQEKASRPCLCSSPISVEKKKKKGKKYAQLSADHELQLLSLSLLEHATQRARMRGLYSSYVALRFTFRALSHAEKKKASSCRLMCSSFFLTDSAGEKKNKVRITQLVLLYIAFQSYINLNIGVRRGVICTAKFGTQLE